MQKLILIGGGNMGGAMATRWQSQYQLTVIETDPARRAALQQQGIACRAELAEAEPADLYVLAIKPQQFAAYAPLLQHAIGARKPLLISIMAGIPLADLQRITPHAVRAMPNLPATIGESMSVLCAPHLDAETQNRITSLFGAIGAVAWLKDEAKLHAVTAISGSGPAYLFALMEALQTAAIARGLTPELARVLVTQTMRGAALLADQPTYDAAQLRRQVTSPGGTTEAALAAFEKGNLNGLVTQAVEAAENRSKTLAS